MDQLTLTLPRWWDLHAHFRQDKLCAPLLKAHYDMGCAGILAMPNTQPPVSKVSESEDSDGWSIEGYRNMLLAAGGDKFADIIVPLYLTKDTTPAMIDAGAKKGLLRACKYYPPHGTTGAEHGQPFSVFMENGVFAAMEENNVILCVHGEEHGMKTEEYFSRNTNAEEFFYKARMPRAIDKFPALKIVAEHVTTRAAVDLVSRAGNNIAANITPQHLIYTVSHLLRGLKYHLYCLPLVKWEEDREALRRAVISPGNTKFFAGTDSAPHAKKATSCGCAAGCYTGGVAPQLYAEAFELAGADLSKTDAQAAFKKFLCVNGPAFYGLPVAKDTFDLEKKEQSVEILRAPGGDIIPLPVGMQIDDPLGGKAAIPWSIR
ncbi:MAG TPA: dihydroorotase [Patescibacteria group bacterium]|nr:dihydroorotase [Patescibacteria group bacterium]